MIANQDGAEIGVRLREAIVKARLARGAKPEIAIVGGNGGLTWSVGAAGGKPAVGVVWEGRF